MTKLTKQMFSEIAEHLAFIGPMPPEIIERLLIPYYAVDSSDGIFVTANGELEEERFVLTFRDAWQRLPREARQRLAEFWRTDETRFCIFVCGGMFSPHIEFTPFYGKCLGECKGSGHFFGFNSRAFSLMPDDVGEVLIAHELAHAFQFATGRFVFDYEGQTEDEILEEFAEKSGRSSEDLAEAFDTMGFDIQQEMNYARNPNEQIVAEIISDWGFDEGLLDEWEIDHDDDLERFETELQAGMEESEKESETD